MGETAQPDWQTLAREKYAGFTVRGNGPFAVCDFDHGCVLLFNFRLEASTKGHVIELQPPQPRPRCRQINIRD